MAIASTARPNSRGCPVILSLRALGLPLAKIGAALDGNESLAEAIASHLALLEEHHAHIHHQIPLVQQTLDAIQKGVTMSIEDLLAGIDHSQYEAEVRQQWGDSAWWELSAKRRAQMTDAERQADDARSLDVNVALREASVAPESERFQSLVADHHR